MEGSQIMEVGIVQGKKMVIKNGATIQRRRRDDLNVGRTLPWEELNSKWMDKRK